MLNKWSLSFLLFCQKNFPWDRACSGETGVGALIYGVFSAPKKKSWFCLWEKKKMSVYPTIDSIEIIKEVQMFIFSNLLGQGNRL